PSGDRRPSSRYEVWPPGPTTSGGGCPSLASRTIPESRSRKRETSSTISDPSSWLKRRSSRLTTLAGHVADGQANLPVWELHDVVPVAPAPPPPSSSAGGGERHTT